MHKTLGLYLHIPFCRRKCRYCDFCSYPCTDTALPARYLAALETELAARAPHVRDYTVESVFLGGGTPTLLSGEQLAHLATVVRRLYDVSPTAEWTSEANPATIDEEKAYRMREAGYDRLSLGLQSWHAQELEYLGRLHTRQDFLHSYRAAQAAGFSQINIDLMYAIPYQTLSSWQETLEGVLSLAPAHLSAYALQWEEGTPLYEKRASLPVPDEDSEAAMYTYLCQRMQQAGYAHYEISNYARPGCACRHNLRYWRMGDYLGFGPAAHSLLGDRRTANRRDLPGYLADPCGIQEEEEHLTPADREYETIMLALRLQDGIEEEDFYATFGHGFTARYGARFAPYQAAGLLRADGTHVALTERGMLLSNTVIGGILS